QHYRGWAELWSSRLIGNQSKQNHIPVSELLLLYPDLRNQNDAKCRRRTASRGALEATLEPADATALALERRWRRYHYDMIRNLQIWWWASQQTKDRQGVDLGYNHALRPAQWLLREKVLDFPNHAAPGQAVFTHK